MWTPSCTVPLLIQVPFGDCVCRAQSQVNVTVGMWWGRAVLKLSGFTAALSAGKFYPKKQWLILSDYPGAILVVSGYEKLWPLNLEWRKLRHSKGKAER